MAAESWDSFTLHIRQTGPSHWKNTAQLDWSHGQIVILGNKEICTVTVLPLAVGCLHQLH